MDSSKLKKILILHASAGHGHCKAAEAIEIALKQLEPHYSIRVFDALDFFPPWVKKQYVDGYVFMMTHAKPLWAICFYLSNFKLFMPITRCKRRLFNSLCAKRLEKLIETMKPDAIVGTHFMPPEVAGAMKKKALTTSKTVTVITDFLAHRFWLHPPSDLYCVALETTKTQLIKDGIDPETIVQTGIPIDPIYSESKGREAVAKALGVNANQFTVLFTSGGVGAMEIDSAVKTLAESHPNIQIIVVAGSNDSLKKSMNEIAGNCENMHSYGFINNMDEMMEVSDLIVGKSGGLTVSESLAKLKPLIVLKPVPGQETYNANVIVDGGAGYRINKVSEAIPIIEELSQDKAKYQELLVQCQKLANPDSAIRCAREIQKIVQ
ncbi:MAG: processive 1,2-diacylglycerol beta-glucosyltransferase [Candidatus Omnitrophota bacterium]|jgi:processive 1,2-diacylglycerol beta-glucosyltransferase